MLASANDTIDDLKLEVEEALRCTPFSRVTAPGIRPEKTEMLIAHIVMPSMLASANDTIADLELQGEEALRSAPFSG